MIRPRRSGVLRWGWVALAAFAPGTRAEDPDWLVRTSGGLVASDSAEASWIGADVLRAGGNAFDAAIATSFALTVARPESTGIGGGGFMIAYVASENRFVALDFRECAPAAATPERYERLARGPLGSYSRSVYGGNAVGVPGQVAGLTEIHRRFGRLGWRELVEPAALLADRGLLIEPALLSARREILADVERWPELRPIVSRLLDRFSPGGVDPIVGERIARPDLAAALRRIATLGGMAFYHGPIADALVETVRAAGGELTHADLLAYRVREREPLRVTAFDHDFVLMPPPSSGGVCLAQSLLLFERLTRRPGSDAWSADAALHLRVEVMKHAFADRARWLGDPDAAPTPLARLLDPHRLDALAGAIQLDRTRAPREYGSVSLIEDGGTSHFCVVDAAGNVVAITETINGAFGSLLLTEPFGILLNNQLDDFLTVRGQPNLFGLVQGEANRIAPGRRPLSSMSPTIVLKDGRPVLVIGGSGGPRIITSVLNVMMSALVDGDYPSGRARPVALADAMTSLRLHHQWQPDEVFFDREPTDAIRAALEPRGHKLADRRRQGVVQAIQLLPDGVRIGVSDPKKGGRPAGTEWGEIKP